MSEPHDAPPAAAEPPAVPASRDASEPARAALLAVREEIAKVVVGQDAVVTGLVTALLVRGHVLLEGVPGVAKTLLVRTLAASLELEASRVQFTPDLMPADVTGQHVLAEDGRDLRFRKGPVFTNLLLADEINRTPPRTQAALLEAMQERQVSTAGRTWALPDPFLVVATQNPVEYEGTYPLPEAQLDRFLFLLQVPYPTEEQEREIVARHDRGADAAADPGAAGVSPVADAGALLAAREAVRTVRVEAAVRDYVVALARATRDAPAVQLGVSPRGTTMLLHAAKAWAWLAGRAYLTPDEVKAVAKPTLRHRLHLRPEAELDGMSADTVLDGVLASVPVPR
ncbi:AAA family ATPase [Egicoccus halophilus]|uniref:ATPase AAA n=1 Tax=Egicoccus halophilus TaxID=1670830 RepID=A0A8J3A982_9ACTN|nr:MoxR family ATPase [Egicoccus halophilus]GGI04907.1 ATPase AAA [Egicoccus halophilus]